MGRRRRGNDSNDAGQDSFLDIVANIVGILIILVMVMGVRAKHAPVALSIPDPQDEAARREYEEDLRIEQGLHASVLETAAKIKRIEARKKGVAQARAELALMNAAAEKIIEKRRDELDANRREQFDQERELHTARDKLASLENQCELLGRVEPKTKTVTSYSTPLSRIVNGHEIHLQLLHGRVTVIPWEEIVEELKAAFQSSAGRMRTRPELTSQTRPIDGFRVRYTIRQHTVSMRTYEKTGRGGAYISLDRFQLVPVSEHLGVPLEQAMMRGSKLSETLGKHHPKRTTVTIWVYPDSFPEYRKLKESLYHAGFSVATWPRSEGELIGGSPHGSRSAAQ